MWWFKWRHVGVKPRNSFSPLLFVNERLCRLMLQLVQFMIVWMLTFCNWVTYSHILYSLLIGWPALIVSNNDNSTFVVTDIKHYIFAVVFWFQFHLNYWVVTQHMQCVNRHMVIVCVGMCVCVCVTVQDLHSKSIFSVSQEIGRGIADEVRYFYKFHFGVPDRDFIIKLCTRWYEFSASGVCVCIYELHCTTSCNSRRVYC
jgi:hypothetical protein